MNARGVLLLAVAVCFLSAVMGSGYENLNSFTDNLLREVMSRMGDNQEIPNTFDMSSLEDYQLGSSADDKDIEDIEDDESHPEPPWSKIVTKGKDGHSLKLGHGDILGREPSLRDQEYLQHSSLFGHQRVQGGAGEGFQRLKPDGSVVNTQIVKSDGVLPEYCSPPNPCPLGYSAADGCLENFENTAAFSREYQAAQDCICDAEHMFDCPGSTRENEVDTLARSIQNEGVMDSTLNRIAEDMKLDGQHKKVVAKKFFKSKDKNPYLVGEKLPVIAKKTPK